MYSMTGLVLDTNVRCPFGMTRHEPSLLNPCLSRRAGGIAIPLWPSSGLLLAALTRLTSDQLAEEVHIADGYESVDPYIRAVWVAHELHTR